MYKLENYGIKKKYCKKDLVILELKIQEFLQNKKFKNIMT